MEGPELKWFVLDQEGNPVPVNGMQEWGRWHEHNSAQIAYDEISEDVYVSTIFLGHGIHRSDQVPTRMFETMVFGGKHDQFQLRASTRQEALDHHRMTLDMVRGD